MNETRYDWLTDRWVIFAPNREERPDQFRNTERASPNGVPICPFCCGSEHETPAPTLVLPEVDSDLTTNNRAPNSSPLLHAQWQVRVVPNKFPAIPHFYSSDPALQPHHDSSRTAIRTECNADGLLATSSQATLAQQQSPIFQRRSPRGGHEVIIESPQHVDSITALSTEHISLVFESYRRRLIYWRAQRDLKYAVVFKNFGADAGASLFHSHSQLISLDFVPRDIERIQERMALYLRQYGQCYLCQLIGEEEMRNERIVLSTDHFVALCPFASRFPFSFTIVPRAHRGCFEEIAAEELVDLAHTAKRTLLALEAARPSASYNFVLQTSPFQGGQEASSHWRLRVIPRMSKVAGFEWGSDCFINTVTPEHAAQVLRKHLD